MSFKNTADGIEFVLDESLFEQELKRLEIIYKFTKSTFLSLILLDDVDAREYFIKRLKEFIPTVHSFDIGKEGNNLHDINRYIKEEKAPLVVYNFEEYYPRVMKEYECSKREAKKWTFCGINMTRDSVFLRYNSKFFMILNDEDYSDFTVEADDFTGYCMAKVDFNNCFINENNISLSEYNKNKVLSKILKK